MLNLWQVGSRSFLSRRWPPYSKATSPVMDNIDLSDLAWLYTAEGDWTWDSAVTLVAQSASKYYANQGASNDVEEDTPDDTTPPDENKT